MTAGEPIVAVHDVFVAHPTPAGAVMALRGADLTLAAGERLLVQGPNGSGKSTLMRVISGEQPVVAGTVRVRGNALHTMEAAQRRRWRAGNVGFLDQHAWRNLLPEQGVLDNVALQLALLGHPVREARGRARRALEDLRLEGLTTQRVVELSSGEAQQVAVCAAVAHRPALMLADEPTGELDERAAAEVYDLLSRIAASGTSVVLVSHDPRAPRFADRTVRVRDGRIAEERPSPRHQAHQVPDSRGWVRIPPELLPAGRAPSGFVAGRHERGVLLVPADAPGPSDPAAAGYSAVSAGRAAVSAVRPDWPADGAVPWLSFSRVSASFGELSVFTDLDLRLGRGDVVAVLGRAGSGKSTLLSLAAGLLDASSGEVRVGGENWLDRDRQARAALRRRWVALAPQRPALAGALTVRENLDLTTAVRRTTTPAGVERVADRLGLRPLLDQRTGRLSGGERQRVALARTLVSAAPVLLLDEPTSAQDEDAAQLVIGVLAEEATAGRAVLTTTGDPRLAGSAARTVSLERPRRR